MSASREDMLRDYLASGGSMQELLALEDKLAVEEPRTDDELWLWVKRVVGIEIPRVAVCEGHVAPFTVLADLYFRRTTSAVLVANRGGGKTFTVALLHYCNGLTRRGVTALTFGATLAQADRCYQHLKNLVGPDMHGVRSIRAKKTEFTSGGTAETVAGSVREVNGPHPNIAHADEVELMDGQVWQESRGMALSSIVGGKVIPAQDIVTSTRKRGAGPMQRLLDEVAEAKLKGIDPPYDVYTYCIFEVAAQVPNCQVARPELGEGERCPCDKIVKGTWEDGSPRSLRDCCKGRLYRSRGFFPFHDVRKKFLDNIRSIWEAQHTCEKPSLEGMVYPMFMRERHCLTGFEPDPANGPIYSGHDFGGNHPFAAVYMQELKFDVEAVGYGGETRRLTQGSWVVFSEVYKGDIGHQEYIRLMQMHEYAWRERFPDWKVTARFADPQGLSNRRDMAEVEMGCTWFGASRVVQEGIPKVGEALTDGRLYVHALRAPTTVDEMEAYHYPPKKPEMIDDPDMPVDDFNHALDALRYIIVNLKRLEGRGDRRMSNPQVGPKRYVMNDGHPIEPLTTPIGIVGAMPTGEEWRARFTGLNPGGAGGEAWRA